MKLEISVCDSLGGSHGQGLHRHFSPSEGTGCRSQKKTLLSHLLSTLDWKRRAQDWVGTSTVRCVTHQRGRRRSSDITEANSSIE